MYNYGGMCVTKAGQFVLLNSKMLFLNSLDLTIDLECDKAPGNHRVHSLHYFTQFFW